MGVSSSFSLVLFLLGVAISNVASQHNYDDALTKSILFFEGQRSGKLPTSQRMKWRKDSALQDGADVGIDLTGGYYDAGDNVKFNFPMAFTTTVLAWGVIEFNNFMGSDLVHANEAIRWGTDYFMKATNLIEQNKVYIQVADPYSDHNCWERPEDMDTIRKAIAVTDQHPGSEVSAEIAAALAASSIVFKTSDPAYSNQLLARAIQVFNFADKYRGSYDNTAAYYVCPFYCDTNGYQDELAWAAAWLYKATNERRYFDYVINADQTTLNSSDVGEFGWDNKHAGIYVLIASDMLSKGASDNNPFREKADQFVCTILPESPTVGVQYSPGGLLFKPGGSNLQHPTALSFLLLTYSRYLAQYNKFVKCGDKIAKPPRLVQVVKGQVDYILGQNPLKMSYMVGYGTKYPMRIHHRGSSLPSVDQHPERIQCHEWNPYFDRKDPNPNVLTGAIVGGPFPNDTYPDTRRDFRQSEPTTYINAPFVGVLAYFTNYK